ncbi:sodium-coupled monocarboxylate transporter 1-like [Eriocheir sinensis]|uniref:sodium-coupled monocarboxylate transporter 1-like n=1 Tax=Eriocheir sinensis TaxID=95602 RepID=UPI0021C8D069|nr:sodium-coupled monocarboxylate transporter 1-like [Eriocheir sinensis]
METTASIYEETTETVTDGYEDIGAESADTFGSKFQPADWVVFSLMLVVSVAIGVISAVRSRRTANTKDFLLGGKNMPPLAVAISLLGGIISAISILGNPTEIYFYGTQLTVSLLGCIPGCIVINKIIVPTFYNLELVSLNEYLERRYKSAALRKLATLVTLLSLGIYMGMCLYAPSLALSTVTSLSTFASMAIMGAIVTFYITIGGVKAVVYTDVLQTLLMFGGVLAVVVLCCIDLGGAGEVWDIARRGGRLEFFNMDTNPYVRHTFWSTFAMGFFLMISGIGINQTTYQRFASVRTLNISKGLSWFFLGGLWCLWCLFFFSGLVAYATYSTCDPFTSGKIKKADQIIPFLVTDKVGYIPGMSGLFVAAVYGGVLSSLSSTGNSAACLVWEDFLKPLPFFSGLSDSSATLVVKILSSLTGVVAVGLGLLMGNLGNIFHVILSITSAVSGPLAGVFMAGILLPWTNAKGAFVGFFVSFIFNMWIAVGKFLRGGGGPTKLPLSVAGCPDTLNVTLEAFTSTTISPNVTTDEMPQEEDMYDISYCFYGLIGISITLVVSGLVSVITGPTPPKDVEGGVVNPTCERLYKWAWQKWQKARGVYSSRIFEGQYVENLEKMSMMPQVKSDVHSPM